MLTATILHICLKAKMNDNKWCYLSQSGKTRNLLSFSNYFVKTTCMTWSVDFTKFLNRISESKFSEFSRCVFLSLGLPLKPPSQIIEGTKKKRLMWLFQLKLRTQTSVKMFTVFHLYSNCIFESYQIHCVLTNCTTNFWRLLESLRI